MAETADDRAVRFRQGVQKTRFITYGLSLGIGVFFRALDVIHVTSGTFFVLFTCAFIHVVVCHWWAATPWARRNTFFFDIQWTFVDISLITAGVLLTGGYESPWFIWYFGAAAGAAFTTGRAGSALAAIFTTSAYLGALLLSNEVAFGTREFWVAVARMAFLFGAAVIFLVGTADSNKKRREVRALQESESRKVEELMRLTAALDQKSRELAEANAKIREADRMKSQFLANMSHELRTPLNSIIGFSDILRTRLKTQLPEKQVRFLDNINTSGHHLLGIINDILDLSKVEAGKMELAIERISLPELAEGVAEVTRGMASKASIAIELSFPEALPRVPADPVKLKQVLYNLLSNAVKFSPDGATVTLSARAVPGALEIAVRDRGIGISPEDQQLIFEPFRQADGSSTRTYSGTGLGLSLVKSFVELHGGSVSVESARGDGSTFRFTLPLVAAEDPPPEDLTGITEETGLFRILVVEDDPAAFQLVESALRDAGYIPLRARSGEEALELAKTLRPAAITLDLVLPGLDGWAVLKTPKSDPGTRDIPVVIVSRVKSEDLGLALGADDYLLKPVEKDRLLARLAALLQDDGPLPQRVLLIDDDPAVHELVEAELTARGYVVEKATSGQEGLELAFASPPGVILLDLMMDGMDGFEVASRLREDPRTAETPVVVVTARDLSQEDRRRLEGKITALLQKGESGRGERIAAAVTDVVRRRRRTKHRKEKELRENA